MAVMLLNGPAALQAPLAAADHARQGTSSPLLFGPFTAAVSAVDGVLSSDIPLAPRFGARPRDTAPADTLFLAAPSGDPLQLLRYAAAPAASPGAGAHLVINGDHAPPGGRASPPLSVLLFIVILALSNLPGGIVSPFARGTGMTRPDFQRRVFLLPAGGTL